MSKKREDEDEIVKSSTTRQVKDKYILSLLLCEHQMKQVHKEHT